MHEPKPFVVFGFEVPDSIRHKRIEPSLDLVQAAPQVSEHRVPPGKETRAQLNRVAAEIFKRMLMGGCDTAVFVSGQRLSSSTVYVMTILRRLNPSLRIVIADGASSIEVSLKALHPDVANFVVRETEPEKVVALLPQIFADPRQVRETKVYWRDEAGIVEWNKEIPASEEVLLILMPAWNNEFAPFGLAHVSSALKSAGFGVKILDLNCLFWAKLEAKFHDCEKYENYILWSTESRYMAEIRPHMDFVFEEIQKAVRSGKHKYYGFSVFETNRIPTENACGMIREMQPGAKTFAGGPSCIPSWAIHMLQSPLGLDGAVFGEGELSAIDLLTSWRDGDDRAIPGAWKKLSDGTLVKSDARPLADMKKLPPPDFDGFPLYNYRSFTLPIFFSRGCVAKCTFCSETQYWKKFRVLDVERVLETIGRGIREYGITDFMVNDSLMNGSHKMLEEIVDGIIQRGYEIEFSGYCRLEEKFTTELIRKLARAGCRSISFGMESGSQKVIDLMQKHVKISNYQRILRDTHEAGIKITACVIVGYPGETWLDFFKTVLALVKNRRYLTQVNLSILEIAENTPLGRDMTRHGVEYIAQGPTRAWRTIDGKNTIRVRYMRYRILRGLWKMLKKRKVSPTGWDFEYNVAAAGS